jgi:hypothetical protein
MKFPLNVLSFPKFREILRNDIKIARNTKEIFLVKFREISYPPYYTSLMSDDIA